jgi:hypothetical protein
MERPFREGAKPRELGIELRQEQEISGMRRHWCFGSQFSTLYLGPIYRIRQLHLWGRLGVQTRASRIAVLGAVGLGTPDFSRARLLAPLRGGSATRFRASRTPISSRRSASPGPARRRPIRRIGRATSSTPPAPRAVTPGSTTYCARSPRPIIARPPTGASPPSMRPGIASPISTRD